MLKKSMTTLLTTAVVTATVGGTLAQQPPPAPAGRQGAPGAGRGGRPQPGGFLRVPALPFPESAQELEMSGTKYRVVPAVKGLVNPWSLTFLPNGDMLVTEKPGRLRIVRKGVLDPQAVTGTPEVVTQGQGGLLEVLPHPQFDANQYLYLTYSKACATGATTALFRGKFDGKALTDARDLFVADNCNTGNPHFGSKLAFGKGGMLSMTIGERGDRNRSQSTMSHGGKILRFRDDGTVPPDNPFVGKDGFKPEIYPTGRLGPTRTSHQPKWTASRWSSSFVSSEESVWPSKGRQYAACGLALSMCSTPSEYPLPA